MKLRYGENQSIKEKSLPLLRVLAILPTISKPQQTGPPVKADKKSASISSFGTAPKIVPLRPKPSPPEVVVQSGPLPKEPSREVFELPDSSNSSEYERSASPEGTEAEKRPLPVQSNNSKKQKISTSPEPSGGRVKSPTVLPDRLRQRLDLYPLCPICQKPFPRVMFFSILTF